MFTKCKKSDSVTGKYGYAIYLCNCGKEVSLLKGNVKNGATVSCGCKCKSKTWKDSEVQILRQFFPDIKKCSVEIGRSESSVKDKCKKLKLFYSPIIDIWYEKIPIEIRSYLSGHFDGEGCVQFRKRKNTRSPLVCVSISCVKILDLYKTHFNGNAIMWQKTKKVNKEMYRWMCVGYEDLYNFILAILPFSIEKHSQLLCVKEYIETYLKNGKKAGYSKDFIELTHILHKKCSELKKTAL